MAGKLVHFEVPAGDTARAKEFWGSLFGWSFKTYEGPNEYHMIEGTEPGGGLMPAQPGQSGLTVYFDTDDIEATSGQVESLGGSVVMGKTPIPSMGWFAVCKDTEGNDSPSGRATSPRPPTTVTDRTARLPGARGSRRRRGTGRGSEHEPTWRR